MDNGDKKTIDEILKKVTGIMDQTSEEEYKVCPNVDSTLVYNLIFRARQKNDVSNRHTK